MKKSEIRKGALRELFQKLDHVERYVMDRRHGYPRGSSLFSSSRNPEINDKESVIEEFESEIRKMRILGSKLEGWLNEYKKYDLTESQFEFHSRQDFKNLSIKELRLTFLPIHLEVDAPYTEEGIRGMIKSTSMVEKMEKNRSYLYSPVDFEKYLIQSSRNYNKEVSDKILEYIRSVKTGVNSNSFRASLIRIRKNIDPNGHQHDDRKKKKGDS